MIRTTFVAHARKPRRCDHCDGPIEVGASYLNHTIAPNDPDIGNVGWATYAECQKSAELFGRIYWFPEPKEDA